MEYKKKFQVTSDGRGEVYYEDLSCKVTLVVADFRDSIWMISADCLMNKKNGKMEKISNKQKYELYRRVSANCRRELATDEFKFINEDMDNIDCSKNILDIDK
jgi:hypothetical protein